MIPYSFEKDVIHNEDKLIERLKTRRNNMLKNLSEGKLPLKPLHFNGVALPQRKEQLSLE